MNQIQQTLLLLLLLVLSTAGAAQDSNNKIAPTLLLETESGNYTECLVVFHDQADLRGLSSVRGKTTKGHAVFHRLQALARSRQQSVLRLLERSGQPYRSFFIVNSIYLRADRQLLQQLAAFPEVAYIQPNPWKKVLPQQVRTSGGASARAPIEWGLEKINVPEVWAQGIRGNGVIIGGQDTGVEWTHPSLVEKYRGWQGNQTDADHIYNWFDAITAISPLHNDTVIAPENNPCGLSVDVPCDDHNHGTYTMGISVGDDGEGNQIGVAPEAQWIACRNMERGYGSPASYLAGFEWFLAPTDLDGNDPRPDLAPHVINNSWGCPMMEGCTIENWGILNTAVENLRAAGVVVIVSAGNEGPACGSVNDPPAIFPGAFAVGATDRTDTLANFSSRGPVNVDGSERIKPDVVAPGVGIRSAVRNNGFSISSGTSAAGPFVVGVVALMIEANPGLAGEVELIEQILRETTVSAYDRISCGGYSTEDTPNPMTGYGLIDAAAAVALARQVSPTEESHPSATLKVYPNPGVDRFWFELEELPENAYLELFDATGRKVRELLVRELISTIDLSDQAAGLYWWRLSSKGEQLSGKIIKN